MSWRLKDVAAVCNGCDKAVGGPGAVVGPDGPPPGVLPPGAWVQPYQGPPLPLPSPLPESTAPTPDPAGAAKPIPPAKPTDGTPPVKKPMVPDLPKLPVPEVPKSGAPAAAPILPIGYEPAAGITIPDVPRQ